MYGSDTNSLCDNSNNDSGYNDCNDDRSDCHNDNHNGDGNNDDDDDNNNNDGDDDNDNDNDSNNNKNCDNNKK